MKATYTVRSVHMGTVMVPAKTAGGQDVLGEMPALFVNLTPTDPQLRPIEWIEKCPDDAAKRAAVALFKPTAKVEMAGFTRADV